MDPELRTEQDLAVSRVEDRRAGPLGHGFEAADVVVAVGVGVDVGTGVDVVGVGGTGGWRGRRCLGSVGEDPDCILAIEEFDGRRR